MDSPKNEGMYIPREERDKFYDELLNSFNSLKVFAAQIRLARVQLTRGEPIKIALVVSGRQLEAVLNEKSRDADALLEFLYSYICGQVKHTVEAMEDMAQLFPDIPVNLDQYPIVSVSPPLKPIGETDLSTRDAGDRVWKRLKSRFWPTFRNPFNR